MKTFNDFRKLSLFIVWVLVVLLAGIGTTIYANEDSNQDAKKDEKKIKLEPGEIGKGYCRKLTAPKKIKIAKWILKEGSSLPNGLELSETGHLFGIPTEQKKFTFDLQGFDENSNPVIDKDSNKPITYKMSLNIKPKTTFSPSENLRIITGYEISRASSTTGSEKGFLDVYLSQPLPFFINKKGGLRIWGNMRFTSIPLQNNKTIGALSADYFSTLSDLKLNEMTQSAEFLLGIESNIFSRKTSGEGAYNFTLGVIAAYGGSTPIVSEKNPNLVIFNKPTSNAQLNNLTKLYPDEDFTDIEYISFTPEDRNRFYHQLYFGIRLKAYTNDAGISNLPAMFDATYGFNDAASGGHGHLFKRSVVRFDLFLPIKILDIPIYIFGNVFINTSKETIRKPLLLGEPVTENIPSSNSNKLLILTEPANDRDYFKIGIGVDLYKIFKAGQDKADADKTQLAEEKTTNKEEIKKIKKTLANVQAEKIAAEKANNKAMSDFKTTLDEAKKAAEDAKKAAEEAKNKTVK